MEKCLQIYSYSLCNSCRKAIKWLKENNVNYQLLDIVEETPSKEILDKALNQFGDRKKLINTNGISYRSLGASYFKSLSDSQIIGELVKDGKLIKRPFVITTSGYILLGFKEVDWSEKILS